MSVRPAPPMKVAAEVQRACRQSHPVVALESTVITHGLPRPQNLALARDMEAELRREGVVPATVAVVGGGLRVGLSDEELERLAADPKALKLSRRDLAAAAMQGASGGTTVAATLFAAHQAGIQVFATGGIGGVHREVPHDVSSDLPALAEIPLVVVCAGAKSILDLPSTLEYLETISVPLVGYQCVDREFPAFYSPRSGLKLDFHLDSPEAIAAFARHHWGLGLRSAVLVVQPVPEGSGMKPQEIDRAIAQASSEARRKGIHGQPLTPFLLGRLSELTGGRSMNANLALLLNNARLAARIAKALAVGQRQRSL